MALIDGLLAYWELEDDYTDSNGAAPDLVPNSGPVFIAGKVGRAVACAGFMGAGASSVVELVTELIDLEGVSRTFCGWFICDNYTTPVAQPGILSNWVNGAGDVIQWLFWHNGTNLELRIRDAGGADHNATFGGAAPEDAWTFFCLRYNSATGDFSLRINNETLATGNTPSIQSGTSHLMLCSRNGNAAPLGGAMDQVGMWNRVLSDSEVGEVYNAGAGLSFAALSGAGATEDDEFCTGEDR